MAFAEELIDKLRKDLVRPPEERLESSAIDNLNRLASFSLVYRNYLSQNSRSALWLVNPVNCETNFRYSAFKKTWEDEFAGDETPKRNFLPSLQRFRRQMSMRIAYREINLLSDIGNSMHELTLLAEFCLQEVAATTMAKWEKRLGQPWDDILNRPARFCILGLGKLGGGELNFCSDLDLIYFFDGEGCCRKEGKLTSTGNEYFFNRAFQSITKTLQERSEFGFLYNIDLRLRPEGSSGPIVRSLAAMENYYYAAGQTWERLALLRARAVAGDLGLGEEFFESVNPFRYPRYPPEELLSEIAGVKIRTEKELADVTQLQNDLKNGHGGIREIEFFVQALQLLHAGKNPFLQVVGTVEAIERLSRYDLLEKNKAFFLVEAYNFLRKVEHRLQMKEEKQTHSLPDGGVEFERLAESLGFANKRDLETKLAPLRKKVREIYKSLLTEDSLEIELQEWTVFMSGKGISPAISEALGRWFGAGKEKAAATRLRTFALGGPHHAVTREHVQLFVNLARQFDEVLPQLARPLAALERVSKFAESYSARKFFFKTCAAHPRFFQSLCLLLDRSRFTTELLCRHPEIMEEVLVVQIRKIKPLARLLEELADLPQGSEFPKWLWLYVKAEQVRLSISQLTGDFDAAELESNLTLLADAVLGYTLRRVDPEGRLAVVGLGKFGAREMIFGSDLDLIILTGDPTSQSSFETVKQLLAIMGYRTPLGPTYEIDLRLRPHGRDGPLITAMEAFRRYYRKSAQIWEKQLLTRSRFISGNEHLGREFVEFRNQLLYSTPPKSGQWDEIMKMKQRIEKANVPLDNPYRAFKKGPGGLMEIEFLCQMAQLKYGPEDPRLKQANTREVLEELAQLGLLESTENLKLQKNYESLRSLELHLRRDANKAVDTIDKQPEAQETLAKWMGFETLEDFWNSHQENMRENKKIVKNLIYEIITSN